MRARTLAAAARQGETGQAIVTLAMASVFLMMITAIAVETGFAYIQRRNLQNAVDAAVLAGAQQLPESPSSAITTAQSYAAQNVDGLTYNVATVEQSNLVLKITAKKHAATIFSSWFGIGGGEITARASSKVRSALLPGVGAIPFTINYSTYTSHLDGSLVALKEPGGSGTNGTYRLIDINNSPGSQICPYITAGSSVPITDPGTFTEPGAKTGLSRCINDRMTAAVANQCSTLAQVLDTSGKLTDRCNPLVGARKGANGFTNVQPTAVVLIPIATDATYNTSTNGSKPILLAQTSSGARVFGMFLIDASTTSAVNGGPTCGTSGQCDITGRFLVQYNALLLPSGTLLGDYVSGSVAKVVQLVE